MTIDATFLAAISTSYTAFSAVVIDLPGYRIALLDASGMATFNVAGSPVTFTGSDAVYGSLAGIGEVVAGMTSEAPHVTISINPPTPEGLAALADPSIQGAVVQIYEGAINPTTGVVIGSPLRTFKGFIDIPKVSGPTPSLRVDLDCAASVAKALNPQEGRRLTTAWQERHFPGERGLAFNIVAQNDPPWGIEGVLSASGFNGISTGYGSTSGGSYVGGGGYGGGGGYTGGGSYLDSLINRF